MNDINSELEWRRKLTFEQAEGLAPLPTQLQRGQLSKEMRARLFRVAHDSLRASERPTPSARVLGHNWERVLSDWWVETAHQYVDDFDNKVSSWIKTLKALMEETGYADVLGFFQYVLRHRSKPARFFEQVQGALVASRSAYRVVGGDTITPIASDTEGSSIARAFADLEAAHMKGARTHLSEAGSSLSQGRWAESVRQSMQSVESVVRRLGQSNSVHEALKKLAAKGHINRNVSVGLERLYNYTSDEQGIRHALLDDGDAKVDEADALYMLGASAAFVSYLIGKGRATGLIDAANP